MAPKKFKRTSFIWLSILLFGLILLAFGVFTRPAFAYPSAQQTLTAPWSAYEMAPISWTNPKQTRIFVYDTVSSNVWQNTLDGTTLTWGGWKLAGSNSTTVRFRTIDAVVSKTNMADVFMVDSNKNVWHKIYSSTGSMYPPGFQWEDLGPLGGTYTQDVQAVSWGSGRIDLFRSKMQAGEPFLHKWSPSGVLGQWSPGTTTWETISSGRMDTYTTTWGANRLDVIGRDGTDAIVHKWWDGSTWQPSGSWESLNGTAAAKPFVLSWGANRLDIFIRGGTSAAPSSNVYQKTWDGTAWSSWKNLGGGSTYSEITGVSWASGRIDIFEDRLDGVYHKYFSNGVWGPSQTGWEYLGGDGFSRFSVTSWGANRLDLFGTKAADGTLWHLAWNGTSWVPNINSWEALNPHPVVVATPTSRLP